MDDHTVTGRVMAVIEAVAALAERATLAALAHHTGIPKPTVRRIAADLVARGVLVRPGAGYRLGPRLLELGEHAAAQAGLRIAATPHVQELYARTGEIAWISAVTDTANLLLGSAFGPNRAADMRRPWPMDIRGPAFLATAAGRVLLAGRPDLADEVRARPLPRLTPYTVASWPAVLAEVRAAGDGGVAIEAEQSVLGYGCIAAGVRGPDGRTVGILGVAGRVDSLAAHRHARPMLAAVRDIERALQQD